MNLQEIIQHLLDAQAAIAELHKQIDSVVATATGTPANTQNIPTDKASQPTPIPTSFQGNA